MKTWFLTASADPTACLYTPHSVSMNTEARRIQKI